MFGTGRVWLKEAVLLLLRRNCAAWGRPQTGVPQDDLVPLWQQWHQTGSAGADLGRDGGDAGGCCDVDWHRNSGDSSPASEPCSHMCTKHSAGRASGQPAGTCKHAPDSAQG